jgi:hypothetical protein
MSGGAVGLDLPLIFKTARLMGANRVLTKPLDYAKLLIMVKEVLALQVVAEEIIEREGGLGAGVEIVSKPILPYE